MAMVKKQNGMFEDICKQGLIGTAGLDPEFGQFAIADTDGQLSCNSIFWLNETNVSNWNCFQRALAMPDSAFIDKASQHGGQQYKGIMAHAMRDSTGHVQNVILSAMDFSWVNEEINAVNLPENGHLMLVDDKGTIIAGSQNVIGQPGRNIAGIPFYKRALDAENASYSGIGFSGRQSIISTYRIATDAGDMRVIIDTPRHDIFLPAYRSLFITLLTGFAGLALILALVYYWSEKHFVRKILVIERESKKLADGDHTANVVLDGNDELGQLAGSFNKMRDEIVNREEKIRRLAYVDPLTGLANRTRFIEVFDNMPVGYTGTIVVLDIDRFSLINHALGYSVGDLILREIGVRLSGVQPLPKLLARLWGDKFAFLLNGDDKNIAIAFAQSVQNALLEPLILDAQKLDIGGALSIAFYPENGQDPATLLRRTEIALHSVKNRHVSFAFVTEVDGEPAYENLSLIGEMRTALDQEQFQVYYQPKMNMKHGGISGVEALIRWRHPVRGLVAPMNFIPFAEQTGFIHEITLWILDRTIANAAEWQRMGLAMTPSVNLSTFDLLDCELVGYIDGLLKKHQLTPDRLCLEITESALMDEPALALKHLNELSGLGIKLSIDDFGTGQASLAYLQTLPVNELKIDRTFVTSVSVSPKSAAIVRSTILLCHELGLVVVAEGAETLEELNWLKECHCDLVQGYVIAKPMPNEHFLEWLADFNKKELEIGSNI